MKVVAFATIKLNSQRVPQKNLRMVGSKPLCSHILETALKVKEIDEVYVYCSDEKVCDYIPEGAQFLKRDSWLDGDQIRAKDTYTAFLRDVPDADLYIALCTTSPFLMKESLENALKQVMSGAFDSAFAAREFRTFAWYQGKPINYDPADVPRTQDMDPVYVETSAFFIFSRDLWNKRQRRIGDKPYIQKMDIIEGVDIDTMEDYTFACQLAEHVLHV